MSELREHLEQWLFEQPPSSFPGQGRYDYKARYENVTSFLNREVHPHVAAGALIHKDGYLTDHGPEHIRTVIRRAGDLIGDPTDRLSAYEVYLLLLAIHTHDIGMLLGRKKHEAKAGQILMEIAKLHQGDMVEVRTVGAIAKAHGGVTESGNKDTISALAVKDHILNTPVRKQFLAAVLRFADELADDRERAARFLLHLRAIPPGSEIYHQYAAHLHSVIIDHSSRLISLHFDLPKDIATRTFKKQRRRVLLLDEIFARTLKMHRERLYCTRFMDGIIRLDVIDTKINVFLSQHHPTPVHEITYRLRERGYPDLGTLSVHDLDPELGWTGKILREDLLQREDRLE